MWMVDLVEELSVLDVSTLTGEGAEAALARSAAVRRWLDSVDVRLGRRIADLTPADGAEPTSERLIARAARRSPRAGRRVLQRGLAAQAIPALQLALDAGEVSGEHVDVVHDGLAPFDDDARRRFCVAHGAAIVAVARAGTPEELRAFLGGAVAAFQRQEGIDRLEAQKRQVRLRAWTDRLTGMVRLSGQFDPESGLHLLARLRATVEPMFHGVEPDGCPNDAEEKQAFLRAHALLALTEQPVPSCAAPRGGVLPPNDHVGVDPATRAVEDVGPDPVQDPVRDRTARVRTRWRDQAVIVVDERTLRDGWHDQSHVDLGPDRIDLPLDAVRRIVASSRVVRVRADAGGVVTAVGESGARLDLGRSTRLASEAQRIALRVMHPTCGMPGCDVPFEHCQIHHVVGWPRGGTTDLDNLLPQCTRHHDAIHRSGWRVDLARDRTVTVRLPGGQVMVRTMARRWPDGGSGASSPPPSRDG